MPLGPTLSMAQIDLFKNYSYSIGLSAQKTSKETTTQKYKSECTMNVIP